MKMQCKPFLLVHAAVSAAFLLSDSTAGAGLPGWGAVAGDPLVDDQWCHGADRALYHGDFNGDGRTDLLCHNASTGRKRIDFSDPDYLGFWGTDWDSVSHPSADQTWCTNPGERILVGDYDGDGKDDLLCYVPRGYPNAGRKRIDFANSAGTFFGTNFDTLDYPSAAQNWCTNEGELLLVGDFDGNGKDDLLCYVPRGYPNAGRKRIDFANSAGGFFGTDFNTQDYPSAAQNWCTNAGESLHVGDYNGDGKDDLLCFVNRGYSAAGRRRIDFANSAGTFFGTDFNSESHANADQSWCVSPGDELKVGDVNRDGKDDLLCANANTGGIRVDHANSAGGFFGTNGAEHWEDWCTGASEAFYVGDFDGDGGADVLCHDATSGYRGIRYGNSDGDFHGVCSNGSVKGDGAVQALPVHFVVAADPNHPDVSDRASRMPTATSTHVHPLDGSFISQAVDPSLYFRAEVDLMNDYTYAEGPNKDPVCVGNDCIAYEYDSHVLYDEIADTSCADVLSYANPPDSRYAANCTGDDCFPNTCGETRWNGAYACAIRTCEDPRIRKPGALTVVIMDRCNWDANTLGINNASCGNYSSFGKQAFLTAWDYTRVLRGPETGDRALARGIEQHELGHVLSLGHTYVCEQNENAMYSGNDDAEEQCDGDKHPEHDGDGIAGREGGYSTAIVPWEGHGDQNGTEVNQVDIMVTKARLRLQLWSCN